MKKQLKIENEIFYSSGHKYEITINPNDACQFFGNVRRLECFVMSIQKLLIVALDNYCIKYKLYIELSEPRAINKEDSRKSRSGSRLHLHGFIFCVDEVAIGEFLLKSQYLLSRFCDVQINAYREDYWPSYCVKQKAIMKALAKYYKVPVVLKHQMNLIKR